MPVLLFFGVSGYKVEEFLDIAVFSGADVKYRIGKGHNNLLSEIYGTMIRSKRVFGIKGESREEAIKNLDLHIKARISILKAAATKILAFSSAYYLPEGYFQYVRDRDARKMPECIGGDEWGALLTLWGAGRQEEWAAGCLETTLYTVALGIALTVGKEAFNEIGGKLRRDNIGAYVIEDHIGEDEAEKDWIPGDWGHVLNERFNPLRNQSGQEGENIIYTGNNLWWGHIERGLVYKSLEDWKALVNKWGRAKVQTLRRYPRVGLVGGYENKNK